MAYQFHRHLAISSVVNSKTDWLECGASADKPARIAVERDAMELLHCAFGTLSENKLRQDTGSVAGTESASWSASAVVASVASGTELAVLAPVVSETASVVVGIALAVLATAMPRTASVGLGIFAIVAEIAAATRIA